MPPPTPINTNAVASSSAQNNPQPPGSDDTPPASPTVPAPLQAVQATLVALEYTLRGLSAIAADVQPPGPDDPPQGRVAEQVNQVITQLAELDVRKDALTQNIPFDVVVDVDTKRNPNRTAKDRIENAAVQNQFVNAQILAIRSYRSLLREALVENFPDLEPHLDVPKAKDRADYEARFGKPKSPSWKTEVQPVGYLNPEIGQISMS